MRRGEIWLVDLEPARPTEAARRRPAVIVSNDDANRTAQQLGRGVVTVVPITSNLTRVYAFEVPLAATRTGLQRDSKAQAEQIRSVAVTRLSARIGHVTSIDLARIEAAMKLHLGL